MVRIWLVDDTERWHTVTRRTVALVEGSVELSSFASGEAAIEAWQGTPAAELPDIVLMDFYLGSLRGDAVTRALRRTEPATHRACIVGYSSVIDRSEQIRGNGGDAVVRKHSDGSDVNPSLLRWLQEWQDGRARQEPQAQQEPQTRQKPG